MKAPGGIDDLRLRLARCADVIPQDGPCPDPGLFWEAQRGSLDAVRTAELIDHVGRCPACGEAWRVARGMGAMEQRAAAPPPTAWPRWLIPAAAVLVLVLLLAGLAGLGPGLGPSTTEGKAVRAGQVRSLVAEDVPLPRGAFRLAWTPMAGATGYVVRVASAEFEPVYTTPPTLRTECTVPAEALAALPAGERVVWEVEALDADGRRHVSPAFFATVE